MDGLLQSIIDTLVCYLTWLGNYMYYAVVEAIEFVLDAFLGIIAVILSILPTADLGDPNLDGGALGTLNYFLPVSLMVTTFSTIMTAWIIYLIYQWMLKWAKVAD